MIDLAAEKGYLKTTLNIMLVIQMMFQGVWFDESALINLPFFN